MSATKPVRRGTGCTARFGPWVTNVASSRPLDDARASPTAHSDNNSNRRPAWRDRGGRSRPSVQSTPPVRCSHRLGPVHSFKLSTDPQFAARLRDIAGLYIDPPAHAVVLSVDEKSQIQALDRTQPGLPSKNGRCATMTHDCKRHGTTTLFAALDVLEGKVIGRCMQRHRHQEFIRFLNGIEATVPVGKIVHVILDNYGAHKHPRSRRGWTATRASSSTTRRPPARGSTPSRASSPS